ncbi:hypothetical protein [Marinomonas sp. GJ51-6]|uniref:hypothetical protein n=1 Tax=Marinomonas sp. GJ51-6 TaxID=2992802 RepID=UPI002934C986|nr:hypothetical protein [Marinomonas sp. GJ51-6]WOD06672.1 hypothetical protein ONZ50_13435 [Marinomonas sp. GJ51-6]
MMQAFNTFNLRIRALFSYRLVRPWNRRNRQRQHKTVSISLNKASPIAKVDARFLSFSIDISVLAGGFWWEGSKGTQRGLGTQRVEPLDLSQPALDNLVNALGSAYVRVGGSEADKVHYFTSATPASADSLELTQEMWNQLHGFCQRNDLALMFTMKYGLFERRKQGGWQTNEVEALLEYCQANQQKIDIFETRK